MRTVLIVFESQYGQTKRIAAHVASLATSRGFEACVRHAAEVREPDITRANAVVLLAPIYNRRHADSVREIAIRYRALLRLRRTAFVSVSLAAALRRKRWANLALGKLLNDFLDETGLEPACIAAVAGGLNYPAYSRNFRVGMRLAAFLVGLPTDPSRAHELTDWERVDQVVDELLTSIEDTRRAPAVSVAQPF
jgi:menaquinone-dependent protoporphyrinogen oxidase